MVYGENESSKKEDKVSFKQLRKKLKLSQKEFAAMIGSDNSEISRIENGRSIPEWYERMLRLNMLAKKAGITLDDLALSLPDPDCDLSPKVAEKSEPYQV